MFLCDVLFHLTMISVLLCGILGMIFEYFLSDGTLFKFCMLGIIICAIFTAFSLTPQYEQSIVDKANAPFFDADAIRYEIKDKRFEDNKVFVLVILDKSKYEEDEPIKITCTEDTYDKVFIKDFIGIHNKIDVQKNTILHPKDIKLIIHDESD